MNLDQQSLITVLILSGTPILGMVASATGVFNLGKKELDEWFSSIDIYVKKRGAENLIKVMFPEKIGVVRTEANDIQAEDEAIKTLACEIDRVAELDLSLIRARTFCERYYFSLWILIWTGLAFVILKFVGVSLDFLNPYLNTVDVLAFLYVTGAFSLLWMKRNSLKVLYEKEYDI